MTETLTRPRRTDGDLWAQLLAEVASGRLKPNPSADAIRSALRCAPAKARALRDRLRADDERGVTEVYAPNGVAVDVPDRVDSPGPIKSGSADRVGFDPTPPPAEPDQRSTGPTSTRWHMAVWAAGLLVAVVGAALTSVGGWAVAHGAGVPPVLAAGYPAITDGLALTAYASTGHLQHRRHRAYAWCVVVLCAGLSAVAQAVYGMDAASLTADTSSRTLRAAVHGWPAVAVAIAAHLVWLVRDSMVEANR